MGNGGGGDGGAEAGAGGNGDGGEASRAVGDDPLDDAAFAALQQKMLGKKGKPPSQPKGKGSGKAADEDPLDDLDLSFVDAVAPEGR